MDKGETKQENPQQDNATKTPMATVNGKVTLPPDVEQEIRQIVEEFGAESVYALIKSIKKEERGETKSDDDDDASVGSRSTTSSNSADYFSRHNSRRIQQAMLEASFDANFAVNQMGIIKHVNKAAVEQFGYASKEEMIGQNIKLIVGGGHAGFHDGYLQTFRETGIRHLIGSLREVSGKRKDGSEFPCVIGIEVIHLETKSQDDHVLYFASIRDITKQKEAERLREQALQDQKVRAAILDTAFDSMFAIDLEGTIQMVNKAAVTAFGYASQEELVGQNIQCIVGGGHNQLHDDYLKRYKDTGETRLIGTLRELPAKKKDGTEFPVVIGIQRVERGDTNDPLMVAFVRDITLQKKTQEDQRIRSAILDASFDSMFAIDLHGTIQTVNQAALETFGYNSFADLVGKNVKCIVGGDHADSHDDYLKRYRETGETHLIGTFREVPARRSDGTEFPAIIGIKRVEMDDKNNALMVAFVRDITKRKEAERLQEEALTDQKIRAAILDASFDAMFAMDTFGNIKIVNKAAIRSFGYSSADELLGRNINILVGGGHAEFHDDYLKAYRETGETHIIGSMREVFGRRKDGTEFPLILGIERIESEGDEKPLMVAFAHDITEQKKAMELEIEIRAAEELLCNMLPEEIASRLKLDPHHIADHHEKATILFADIVGFTAMSATMSPVDLVKVLNDLFTRFDRVVDRYGLNKVKTIGDCYMVTSIPSYQNPDNAAAAMCHFALDMIDALNEFNGDNPTNKLDLRVGINTGPVVAGVVAPSRFLYDLWGDSVNLASRMESTGVPSRVQVTQSVVDSVPAPEFDFVARGPVQVKGKGLVHSFFLEKRIGPRRKYYVGYGLDEDGSSSPIVSGMPPSMTRRRSTLQEALMALQSSISQMEGSSLSSAYSRSRKGGFDNRSLVSALSAISTIGEEEFEDQSNPDLLA